jgi:hypothetical protein
MIHAAAHGQLLHPTSDRHVHPLHLNHPLRARPERRPRLVSSLPRDACQHSRPHRCETCRNTLPPHVDRRQPISRRLRPSQSQLPPHSSFFQLTTCPPTAARSRRSYAHLTWIVNHRPWPRCRCQCCSLARAEHERPSYRRCQLDRCPEPLRSREWSVAQRPRRGTATQKALEFELSSSEHG